MTECQCFCASQRPSKVTALFAFQAITAALLARERGHGGQHLELSMVDAVTTFLWADAAANEVLTRVRSHPALELSGRIRPIRFTDGWGIVTPTSDHDFAGMCRAFGATGFDDPRVATIAERIRNRDILESIIDMCYALAANLSMAEATARLEHERVPFAMILSPEELPEDPHALAMGLFVEADHTVVGRTRLPRHPTKFSGTPATLQGSSPSLGQHTDDVLAELGLADSIADLRGRGVVA